jgi:hypothetical protein
METQCNHDCRVKAAVRIVFHNARSLVFAGQLFEDDLLPAVIASAVRHLDEFEILV